MSKDIVKRIQVLERHPVEYIKSRLTEFNEATSNSDWATIHIKKRFNKELNSKDTSSGYGAILVTEGRSPFMIYWAQSKILNNQPNEWELISMALDSIWWAFRCRPSTYGDCESLVQLMLPWFDIVGHNERKNFLGLYFSGNSDLDGHEEFTKYSSVGKFITRIWLWESGKYTALPHGNLECDSSRSFYNNLMNNIENSDPTALTSSIIEALDYHVRSASTENGEFRTAYPFYLLPLEISYYVNARKRKGLETEMPKHPIFSSRLSCIDNINIEASSYNDSFLSRALDHAIKTGWFSESDVARYSIPR